MTDREMLELAAKAAGLDAWWSEPFGYLLLRKEGNRAWRPLADDGDALRLAARLKIDLEWQHVEFSGDVEKVEAYIRNAEDLTYCPSYPAAEYKRAIVDVAAAAGRAIP